MARYTNNPFDGELEVVASLSGQAIRASIRDLQAQDDLTVALRAAIRAGVSIDNLSAESGLTPSQIRSRVSRSLYLSEDLTNLAGIR